MGEILRAVMTDAAMWTRPTVYMVVIPIPVGVPVLTTLSALFQTKSDRWALITSFYVALCDNLTGTVDPSNPLGVNIYDPQTLNSYLTTPADGIVMGGPVNGQFTLPEYILLEPDRLLGFSVVTNRATVLNNEAQYQLQMQAIEYAMPGG